MASNEPGFLPVSIWLRYAAEIPARLAAQRHRAPSGGARGRDHGLKAILDRHERALALLGRRLPALEGADKE
jgi:hypothetical protein